MPAHIFHTSDIALASYLMIQGFGLSDITFQSNRKAIFHFEDGPERPALILRFINRQSAVEPLAFLENLKNLKGMLSQQYENKHE